MKSLRLLVATAAFAVASSAQRLSASQEPTTRDRTAECKRVTDFAPDERTKCELFALCCRAPDPLNGDKCRSMNRICQVNDEGELELSCIYTDCTEMITSTSVTTTLSTPSLPLRQTNGASSLFYSAFLSAPVLLPVVIFMLW